MKHSIFFLIILTLHASCGSHSDVDKKTQLENLKKERDKISEQIKNLENEIAVSDTTLATRNVQPVVITELKASYFKHYVEIQGKIESDENVSISPKTPGTISNIPVKKGEKVTKEQVLAELDATVILKSLEEVKTSMEFATHVFEKQQRLWEQKIGTEIQFLSAKNNKESLEKRFATLQEQFEMTKIKSPINGTVDAVIPKIGETVMPGFPAFRIVNYERAKITVKIPENYVQRIKYGDDLLIFLPDINKNFNTTVNFIGQVIDPASRTFDLEAKLPTHIIANPNMLAVLKINDFTADSAIVIPINIVQKEDSQQYVFIVEQSNGNNISRKRYILTGLVNNNNVHVTGGLKSGDQLITTGFQDLTDGQDISF